MGFFRYLFSRKPRWLIALFLVLIPLIILAATSYRATSHTLTEAVKDRRLTIATLSQKNLTEQFEQLTALNRRFAVSETYRKATANAEWDAAAQRLKTVPAEFPYVEGVFIIDNTNVLRVDTGSGADKIGSDFSQYGWYQEVTSKKLAGISDIYRTPAVNESETHNVIAIISPIYNFQYDQQIIGWMGFRVPVEQISKSLATVDIGDKAFIYLTDTKGRLAVHPHYNTRKDLIDFSSVPIVQRALAGHSGIDETYNPIEKENRLASYISEPKYKWAVVATQPSTEAFAKRNELQRFIQFIYAIILMLILTAITVVLYLTHRLRQANLIDRRQAARTEAIFASIGEGLIVVNEYGNVEEANSAALKMLGFAWSDLKGKWYPGTVKILGNDGKILPVSESPLLKSTETGAPVSGNVNYITKAGDTLPVFLTATPLLVDNKPAGAINIFHDRSEEMKIEHAKDEFVSIASHQLRTPLTAMRLFTEMLMDGQVGELTNKQKEYLSKVEQSTERMIRLVSDILNVSRLELGRLKIKPIKTDLIALLQTYIDDIEPLATEKGITINLTAQKGDWSMLLLDPTLMGQIIHNLLSNAVHYTNVKKGIIEIGLKRRNSTFIISVGDNGIGIPNEFKHRIFQRFNRADNAVAVEGQGTGLGLYLIKMIVDAAGGKVTFKSQQNKGTTFYVTFPLSGMKPHEGEKI